MDEVDAELGEGVIAGDGRGLNYADVDNRGVLFHILRGLALEISVESGNAAGKGGTVVEFPVERLNLHCGACLRWVARRTAYELAGSC